MDRPHPPTSMAADSKPEERNMPDYTGQTLGEYRLLRRLGQGGMGQVYLAEQISLKRKVALKLLRGDLGSHPTALERFKREAEAVARATHANIVQVYAIGEDSGRHYMALEYVEGKNLRDYLEKKGPPDVLISISILRQVAAALQRAHELGVIHRDIKPENILMTRSGEVKVADFGLSRIFADDQQPLHLTQSGVTMGTPLYMSPEQVEGKPIDPRTDIYSLGVTAYHLLAGEPPFRGQTPFEVALQHVQKTPLPLSELRPDLPPELCALVHRMLAKLPDERCQTAKEITRELARLRDVLVGVSGTIVLPAWDSSPELTSSKELASTEDMPAPRPPGRRWLWLTASVLLMLAAGYALGQLVNRWQAVRLENQVRQQPALPDPFKEREQQLLQTFTQFAGNAGGEPLRQNMATVAGIDLGLFYLQHGWWEEAYTFFKKLDQPEQLGKLQSFGRLGQAMVWSFKDEPQKSMVGFQDWWQRGVQKKPPAWVLTPAVREMVAKALKRNEANAPGSVPPRMAFLIEPPQLLPQEPEERPPPRERNKTPEKKWKGGTGKQRPQTNGEC